MFSRDAILTYYLITHIQKYQDCKWCTLRHIVQNIARRSLFSTYYMVSKSRHRCNYVCPCSDFQEPPNDQRYYKQTFYIEYGRNYKSNVESKAIYSLMTLKYSTVFNANNFTQRTIVQRHCVFCHTKFHPSQSRNVKSMGRRSFRL